MSAMRKAMDGNTAIAWGARLARVEVIAAYPITPQSSMAETLASFIANKELKARYLRVESEHSALSASVGASFTGARAFTATASVGLALMNELTGVAAGCRLPIVMGIANRALCSPWSLWCDHSDIMSIRDQGWISLFAETCQEALDFVLIAYRTAENRRVMLPATVNVDGFFLSHMVDGVNIPDQADVDAFVPVNRERLMPLDPRNPLSCNVLTAPNEYMERKHPEVVGMNEARKVLKQDFAEYAARFGRQYSLVKADHCDDADEVVVVMGASAGTARHVVRQMRAEGRKAGLLRIVSFRPFPYEDVREALKNAKRVYVLDRIADTGAVGPLHGEIRSACYALDKHPVMQGFVAGLGGRDVTEKTFREIFDRGSRDLGKDLESSDRWLDLKEALPNE